MANMSGKEQQHQVEESLRIETEPLMNDCETRHHHILQFRRTSTSRVHYLVHVILTLIIIFLTAVIFVWEKRADRSTNRYHYYSPALEDTWAGSRAVRVEITEDTVPSPFSHGSEEDMDANWTSLLRVGMMGITQEELERVGASPDSVRLPPESGGGYMSYLASHHHLHCLYLLHQSLHPEYYETRSVVWNMSAHLRRSHWDHCVDELREYVMCNADTTVVTYDWLDGLKSPVPNQGNPRVCADWDAHWKWQLDRQVAASSSGPVRNPVSGATSR